MKTIDIAIKEINITKNELKVANKEIIGMATACIKRRRVARRCESIY